MLPHSPGCVPGSSSHPSPSELAEPAVFSWYPFQPEEHNYFHFFSLQMRRIWKTHNGAFYQRVLNGVIHPLCSWRDVPWFIFLGICSSVSAKHCMEVPRGRQPALPICSLKKKKKNPAHNRKPLYCMPRRLGLVKYILVVNNYPI